MKKKTILIGLGLHFSIWWAFSAWFWTTRFHFNLWSLLSPIAPAYLGIFYLQPRGVWQWGVAGVLVSIALVGVIVAAMKKERMWLVISAHLTVFTYWIVGFSLIATGV